MRVADQPFEFGADPARRTCFQADPVNMLGCLLFPDDSHAGTITAATDKKAALNRPLAGPPGIPRLASRPACAV